MPAVVAYHFLPARKPATVRRLLAQLPNEHVVPMLDLEDSAADVLAPARTAALKAAARSNLLALFADGWQPPAHALGVRINGRGSPNHHDDLDAIAQLRTDGHELTVLLPKIEGPADIASVEQFFSDRGLVTPPLYVLIETRRGVEQLPAVLARGCEHVHGVFLGMIDYAYDQRLWPFPGPLDERVWSLAHLVADLAADAGVAYVHTPCLRLRDAPLIREIRRRLESLCRCPAGLLTLGRDQARALLATSNSDAPFGDLPTTTQDPKTIANDVVRRFRDHHRDKRSFSVDAAEDRYIPPQEYLAAVRFLEETEPRK